MAEKRIMVVFESNETYMIGAGESRWYYWNTGQNHRPAILVPDVTSVILSGPGSLRLEYGRTQRSVIENNVNRWHVNITNRSNTGIQFRLQLGRFD